DRMIGRDEDRQQAERRPAGERALDGRVVVVVHAAPELRPPRPLEVDQARKVVVAVDGDRGAGREVRLDPPPRDLARVGGRRARELADGARGRWRDEEYGDSGSEDARPRDRAQREERIERAPGEDRRGGPQRREVVELLVRERGDREERRDDEREEEEVASL